MHYQIYRTKRALSREKLWWGVKGILLILTISTAAVALNLISPIFCLFNGIAGVILFIAYAKMFCLSKELFLKVEEGSLKYFSEEREEMIEIEAKDIEKITSRFCELHIHTRDNAVHRISMSPIKKEQTRWEIKEMIRQLAHMQSFSTAS